MTPILTNAWFLSVHFVPRASVFVKGRPFTAISYRKGGEVLIRTEKTEISSGSGALTYLPAGTSYETEVTEAGEIDVLHFETAEDLPLFGSEPLCITPTGAFDFENRFARALRHYRRDGCDLYCLSAAYELLYACSPLFLSTAPPPHSRMIRAKQYIDEHIADRDLGVETLAASCGVSSVYFRREFKRFYGTNPIAYIKEKRIALACRLLASGAYSVTEVAGSAGFDSLSYFSSEFKRATGMSPCAYRENEL